MEPLTASAFTLLFALFFSGSPCEKSELSQTTVDGFKVEWTDYAPTLQSTKKFKAGTVLILPPTGGSTALERQYAKDLCIRNQRAVIVERWTGLGERSVDFELHNRLFARANRAVQLMADRYQGPLKILGTSLGAQYGLSAILRIARVERAVIIAGGTSFSEVIATSEHESMASLREWRMKEFGISESEAYKRRLSEVFKWDDQAELDADPSKAKGILFVVGLHDDAVPTSAQLAAVKKFAKARVIQIKSDHLWTILKAYVFHAYEILGHLTDPV